MAKFMKSLYRKTKTWCLKSATAPNREGALEPVVRQPPTVEVLPDDVLLDIFDLDRLSELSLKHPWQWHRLIHVCQRWRRVVFSSPRRLDLRLFCSHGTPVKETLGSWPALPIVMRYRGFPVSLEDEEDIMTALCHHDRIHEIDFTIMGSTNDRLAAEMQKTMPSLETLRLIVRDKAELRLPDQFLGGSVPNLSVISLHGVAFPAVPKLLFSASNLVSLTLWDIPRSGYFSPEALVTGFSGTMQLKSFAFKFAFPTSHFRASNSRMPPLGRTVLPALTNIMFCAVDEYSEDLMSRIDTPLLELIDIRFFNRFNFEIPLSHLIRLSTQLVSPTRANIYSGNAVSVALIHQSETPHNSIPGLPRLQITCFDWQQRYTISQFSSQLSPFQSDVKQLDVRTFPGGSNGLGLAQWARLLRPFNGVERLRVVGEFVLHIARVLQRVTSVSDLDLFPALRELFLGESQVQVITAALEAIAPFVSARQLSGHPVRVVAYDWDASLIDQESASQVSWALPLH